MSCMDAQAGSIQRGCAATCTLPHLTPISQNPVISVAFPDHPRDARSQQRGAGDWHGPPADFKHCTALGWEKGCRVSHIPPYLRCSRRDTAALRSASSRPASCSPLPAPSLQLREGTARSVPSAARIQHHPWNFQVTPAELRDNTSYFFTRRRCCLCNSSFTEPSQVPPCPFLQLLARSLCTCSLFHNCAKLISGLSSLAIINLTLSTPPRLHRTCTFPAPPLLSGLSGFGSAGPRAGLENRTGRPTWRSCHTCNPTSQPERYR